MGQADYFLTNTIYGTHTIYGTGRLFSDLSQYMGHTQIILGQADYFGDRQIILGQIILGHTQII